MYTCIYMLNSQSSNDSCYPEAFVRGCVYKNVWAAAVGERLACVRIHTIYLCYISDEKLCHLCQLTCRFFSLFLQMLHISKNWHDLQCMCSVKPCMFRLFNHHNFSSYNFSPWLSESQISESSQKLVIFMNFIN